MKVIVDIMYTHVDFLGNTLLREKVQAMMHIKMGIKEDSAFHSPSYKAGHWDGIVDFYDKKEDKFLTGLLPQFMDGMRALKDQYPMLAYEIEDVRPPQIMHHDSMDESIVLGNGDEEPITLRPYQYNAVKKALESQVQILNLATNAGKTECASGIMQQLMPHVKRGERLAFFCNSKEIFHQGAERVRKRLNLKEKDIGKIGDGKFDIKNKKIVFVMIPTLASALKDPKKGISFTPKERVIKFIAEEITPKFRNTVNTRQLIRNYLKNCNLDTRVWKDSEEQLMYIAYDQRFTDKGAQMQLNKYVVEFDKIMEKKNKKKYKKFKEVKEFMESVRVAIQDEAHEINGATVFDTMTQLPNAQYRIALTGTVDQKNKMLWQRMQCVYGSDLFKVSNEYLIGQGVSSKPVIRMIPITEPKDIELVGNYLEAYKKGISENDARNRIIAQTASWYLRNRPGGVLISVNHIEHGERIQKILREEFGFDSDFTHGSLDMEDRDEYLRRFSTKESRVLIASSILDQGVDIKSIGMLLMSGGNKSLRQNLQRIGRGLRLNGIDGNTVLVFDFYDMTNKHLLSHSKERLKIYQNESFDVRMLGE
ncbi:DNA helicase [Bacillus phage TsarBomba]|uniref:DNA helicase 2 n=1 Tax=Bacillus phage TsarBomba TaxID=1690456 RepID=A0A0K2CZV2_9CAUD|nr:DNA helicase [Bacillus phage TsarBomba]ALA12998.1 DNA helicase 2 [Bacillus phage TsarBomba]